MLVAMWKRYYENGQLWDGANTCSAWRSASGRHPTGTGPWRT